MPLSKVIQKATETEAVVKISGSDTAAATISLATDLLPYAKRIDGAGLLTCTTAAPTVNGNTATTAGSSISGFTLTLGSSNAAAAVGMLVTGSGVAANTYIVSGSGTSWQVSIGQNVASTSITISTDFTTAAYVGAKIYNSSSAYIGTVQSVASNTQLTLTANPTANMTAEAYKIEFTTQVAGTPSVSLIGLQWGGEPGAIYRISRGGTRIATVLADNGNFMDFVELFPPDNVNATNDFSIVIQNASAAAVQGELWLRLRKNSGYQNKIETTTYGVYDNTRIVG